MTRKQQRAYVCGANFQDGHKVMFRCGRCGWRSDYLPMRSVEWARAGISCEACLREAKQKMH